MARKRLSLKVQLPEPPEFLTLGAAIRRVKKKGPKPDPQFLHRIALDKLQQSFGGGVLFRTVADETLSGNRMNANGVAWLVVASADAVDGDSGQIWFSDTASGNAILARLWIPPLARNSKYLVQLRGVARNRQPGSQGLAVLVMDKGSPPATSISMFVPPADGVPFVVPALLTAEDTEPFVIFAGDRLSWTCYDIRIQRLS